MNLRAFILIVLLGLTVQGCGSYETATERFINTQSFTLEIPSHWRGFKNHSHISFSPFKNQHRKGFTNAVTVTEIKETNATSLAVFTTEMMAESNKRSTISNQEITKETNKFDTVFIHQYEFTWNEKTYKVYTMYFTFNNRYYMYEYFSLKNLYDSHIAEANAILNSIEFKQTTL